MALGVNVGARWTIVIRPRRTHLWAVARGGGRLRVGGGRLVIIVISVVRGGSTAGGDIHDRSRS